MNTRQAFLILCWYQRDYMPYEEDVKIIEELILPLLKDKHDKISDHEDSMSYHEVYEQTIAYTLPKIKEELEGYKPNFHPDF